MAGTAGQENGITAGTNTGTATASSSGASLSSTLHCLITWEVTPLRFGAWPPEFLSQKEGDFCASAQTRG